MENITSGKEKSGNILNLISEASGLIAGFATIVMVGFVTLNMILRKAFNFPIPGFYDITSLLGIIFYSFGIVYAAIKGAHISVSIVLTRLPERYRRMLGFFNRIIIVVFSGLLAYAGGIMIKEQWLVGEGTTDLKIPLIPFRLVVVAAFVLLIILILAGKEIAKGGEE